MKSIAVPTITLHTMQHVPSTTQTVVLEQFPRMSHTAECLRELLWVFVGTALTANATESG